MKAQEMHTESTTGSEPLFIQVADQIAQMLERLEGRPLPSERDLARDFSVNRATVRRAIAKLHDDGTLFRRSAGNRRLVSAPDLANATLAVCIPLSEYDYAAAGSKTDWGFADLMGASHIPIHVGASNVLREAAVGGSIWLDVDQSFIAASRSVESVENLLRTRNITGVIYWPILPAPEAVLRQLRAIQARVPLVLIDRQIWGFEADHANFDLNLGGRLMGRHLLDQGHQQIAFIGNALPDFVHTYFLGVESALAMDGRAIAPQNAFFIRNESLDIKYILDPLFSRPLEQRPTALVCANDTLARMALTWLSARGLSAPRDLAVVGVDDCNPVAGELLGLTTLRLSYQELGRTAAQLLLDRISHPTLSPQPLTRLVTPTLMVRRTCGA